VAFVPAPVPRELALSAGTVMRLSEADAAFGRLAGSARLLPDPHLLVNAYITREAVSSSRIEGTQASVTEVLMRLSPVRPAATTSGRFATTSPR
jgi:Fic family protein